MHAFDLDSNWTYTETRSVELRANSSTDIITAMPCPHRYQEANGSRIPTPSHSVVYAAFLRSSAGDTLCQYIDWPQPFKFLEPRDPGLQISLNNEEMTIKVTYPVKGLVFSVPGDEDGVSWSDNCVDVIPGYPYTLKVTGIHGREIQVAYLGREKAQLIQVRM